MYAKLIFIQKKKVHRRAKVSNCLFLLNPLLKLKGFLRHIVVAGICPALQ